MKDFSGKITYKGKEYRLEFNINVMERIQEEYGTIEKWGSLTDGADTGEPDLKAVLFGLTEMLNEGIDIDNCENGTQEPFLNKKQVGRMITEIGLRDATKTMNETVINSTESAEKNG